MRKILAVTMAITGALILSTASYAGEASKGSKQIKKSDVFSGDTTINLFAPDVGILTEKEMAAVKRNLFIQILKADIKKNQKNKS